MPAEHAEALGLEQACIEPGHWVIEGRDVSRRTRGAAKGHKQCWEIRFFNEPVVAFNTLGEVRNWIAGQI
jgi:hypothetical protein